MKSQQKRNAENFLNGLGNRFLAIDRKPDYIMSPGHRVFLTSDARCFSLQQLGFAAKEMSDWRTPLRDVLSGNGWVIIQYDTVALVVMSFGNDYIIDRVTDNLDLIALAKDKKQFVNSSYLLANNAIDVTQELTTNT